MRLIDKDALIVEIERRIKEYQSTGDDYWFPVIENLKSILSFFDTFEVKEMDLDYIKDELNRVVKIYKPNGDFEWGTLYNIATYFFELGLKA